LGLRSSYYIIPSIAVLTEISRFGMKSGCW
jgi:hypothetical protein